MITLEQCDDAEMGFHVLIGELRQPAGRIVFEYGNHFYIPPMESGPVLLSGWFLEQIASRIKFLDNLPMVALH